MSQDDGEIDYSYLGEDDKHLGEDTGPMFQGPRQKLVSTHRTPFEYTIPAMEGVGFTIDENQTLRLTDIEGGGIADLIIFNRNNLRERFSRGRTKGNLRNLYVSSGDQLYSKSNSAMMTITEDTYGHHDLQWGMCNKWRWDNLELPQLVEEVWSEHETQDKPPWGCWENLIEALEPWEIPPENIRDPFNVFMRMEHNSETGESTAVNDNREPGHYVDLRAEMDCVVGISACPATAKPLKIELFDDSI